MITTTTLGAYPKPGYVPIGDWFSAHGQGPDAPVDYTSAYTRQLDEAGTGAEDFFQRATAEVIADQIEAGVDVVTDGEVRRENYVHHQCRFLEGFDFERLGRRRMRGTTESVLPTVVSPVGFRSSPLAAQWRIAQALSSRPVKVTLPGPMTIADSTVDEHYGDDRALGADLARALNRQIEDLVAAGCRHVQVDEPLMARKPSEALDYGIDHLVRCFDGVAPSVTRGVHCCCGYPNRLDQVDYPKADREAYPRLAPALDAAPIDEVSIEDAHRHNDLDRVLPMFTDTTVVLGVVAIASSRVETVAEIAGRLVAAQRLLPPGRLVAAPDCGLGHLSRNLARRKLHAMTTAAQLVGSADIA